MKTIPEWIYYFMEIFPQITQEDSDFIYKILNWEPDQRAGFLLDKQLFEDNEE